MRRTATDKKSKYEYRIVCSGPIDAHAYHAYTCPTLAKAVSSANECNTDNGIQPYQEKCRPWRVDQRKIGGWEPASPVRRSTDHSEVADTQGQDH